jgi:GNAT superfamily N-acetyltransferase
MPRIRCVKSTEIVRTPRVQQLEGMFDVPPAAASERVWEVDLPLEERDWQIGLVVGPSGCGKSTLVRALFGEALVGGFDWPASRSIVDAFPVGMGIREVVGLLSSVGFSSPPSWLLPFRVLSNGEQFRATLARALAEHPDLAVIDEFTSVVDRTAAQIGSAALARTIRRSKRRLVAASCHYDVIDWLDPDWIYDPAAAHFRWRSLRGRPPIRLTVVRARREAWRMFQQHHYLSGDLHRAAQCFVAFVGEQGGDATDLQTSANPEMRQIDRHQRTPSPSMGEGRDGGESVYRRSPRSPTLHHNGERENLSDGFGQEYDRSWNGIRPAAFTAVLPAPDALGGYWREHRTVCLPDFQGVGIGHALSEFVASLFAATGKRYCSRTSHPAMIGHRARSPAWKMTRAPAFGHRQTGSCSAFNRRAALGRLTASFRYIGEPNREAARALGVLK